MSTQLTVIERAAVALGTAQHETNLRELVKTSVGITAVTNSDGREEAHRAAMTLRTARTTIVRASKEAREDATAFSKAVIAEEKRLAEIVEPEEKRILVLRDAWDEKIEAEKQAKIEAEKERVAGIQKMLANIRAVPLSFAATDAATLAGAIEATLTSVIDEATFAEFVPQAAAAQEEAVKALQLLHSQAVEREAEIDRIKAEQEAASARLAEERAELQRMRAETAEYERQQKAQRDAEAAQENAKRRTEQDRAAAELAAERAELAAERQSLRLAQQAVDAARAPRPVATNPAPVEVVPAVVAKVNEDAADAVLSIDAVPDTCEIISVLANYYDTDRIQVITWLLAMDFQALRSAKA